MAGLRMTPEDVWATTNNSGGRYGAPAQPVGPQYPISPEAAAMKAEAGDMRVQAQNRAAQAAQLKAAPPPAGTVPPTAAPPTGGAGAATAEAGVVKQGGWYRRPFSAAADAAGKGAGALRSAGSTLVNGDIIAGASNALNSPVAKLAAKVATPLQMMDSASKSYGTSTDEYAQRAGTANDGGVAKELGLRGLGVMQDLGNTLTGGLADRVGNFVIGNGFNRSRGNQVGEIGAPGEEVGGPQPAAAAAARAAALPAGTFTGGRDSYQGPSAAPPNPNGTILRQGNTYSGKDIKFGADIAGSSGKGTVTSLDTSEGFRQDQMELGRLRAERAEREAQPMGGMSGIGGGTLSSSLRDKHFSTPSASILSPGQGNMKPRDIRHAQSIAAQRDIAAMQEQGATLRAGNQNSQALAIAEMNNATARRSNDQNNSTSLRGQDMTLQGHLAPLAYQQQRMALAGQYMKQFGDPAQAAQAALANGHHDVAEHLGKAVSTMQTQAEGADKITATRRAEIATGVKGAFNHLDKDGQPKMSEALEAQAVARIMRAHPDFHLKKPDERQQILDNSLGDEELMAKFGAPKNGGYADLVPNFISGNKRMLRQDNIPNAELLRNGQIGETVGGLRNLVSPNTSKGDRFYDPGPGYEAVNMGDLSARALRRLDHHIKSSQQAK